MTIFVETLTVRTWLLAVWPRLLWWRARGRRPDRCYLIDSSPAARTVARALGWLAGVTVDTLQFRAMDVRDERGMLLYLKISTEDVLEIRADIMATPIMRDLIGAACRGGAARRLPTYLAKTAAASQLLEPGTLWRALQVVQACLWSLRKTQRTGTAAACFLNRRPWFSSIVRYVSMRGLAVIPVSPRRGLKAWVRRRLPADAIGVLRGLRARWAYAHLQRRTMRSQRARALASGARGRSQGTPRIAVEYYGYFNLDHPERYSDLFFWQQSPIPAAQLLLMFHLPADPLDAQKCAELAEHGIAAIAVDPRATTVPDAPVFLPSLRCPAPRVEVGRTARASRHPDARWLREQVRDYRVARAFWSELFAAQQVKLYVSWFKYTATHCAIADALQDLGGITAFYQRAYETAPHTGTTVDVDIMFGLSRMSTEVERESGSVIPYHVTTGYVGDHRFSRLRPEALRVRRALEHHGAQRILAFADEISYEDARWGTGLTFEQEDYLFLLERLLTEPHLGLILKPKIPSTLRRRLGPVARLLERAQATGRCYVFEGGPIQGTHTVAAAALGADLMVHSRLDAATAGLESALAGVPTLLLDRLGWTCSPLYRLGVGRVVFTEWPRLWQACLEHWARPGGIPGLGDWSPMLPELDPFRDGRAAERMGTYLQWLLDGFTAGMHRDTVMADAAERYAARWGRDTITHINGRSRQPLAAPAMRAGVRQDHEMLVQPGGGL